MADVTFADAYQQHARIARDLEDELLFLIDTAPEEERFNLYWIYNQFAGTWLQMELLRAQLMAAIATDSTSAEEESRTTLRDQAQFSLAELAQAEAGLERHIAELKRADHSRINRAIRELLSAVRISIDHLLQDQCVRVFCAPGS